MIGRIQRRIRPEHGAFPASAWSVSPLKMEFAKLARKPLAFRTVLSYTSIESGTTS